MLDSTNDLLNQLFKRYPALLSQKDSITEAFLLIKNCFSNKHSLYVCGNGGSAADSQHIVGELTKSFKINRPVSGSLASSIYDNYPNEANYLISNLEGALPAYSLPDNISFITAFNNDAVPEMLFAQQVNSYMNNGDVLWGITTSGNSKNIINAFKIANSINAATIALTGCDGGAIKSISKVTITVPETDTYKVQELHMPVYHTICLMLENEFFSDCLYKDVR